MNRTEIIIAVIGFIGAVFGGQGFWTWWGDRKREKSDDSKLIMGIAYSKIRDLCEGHLSKGYITTKEFHELEHYLYKPYRSKGGNGTIEILFSKVQNLPLIPDEDLSDYLNGRRQS